MGLLVGAAKPDDKAVEAFRDGLRHLGYLDGRTVKLEFRTAEGDFENLPALAAELVKLQPDVIVVTNDSAARILKRATSTIPIVLLNIFDPVLAGLVTNLARPGGNITGLTSMASELIPKRLQLLQEAIPKLSAVTILRNPGPGSQGTQQKIVDELQRAGSSLSLNTRFLEINKPEQLSQAFRSAPGVQGVYVSDGALFYRERKTIAKLAADARIPVIYATRVFAEDGGLMSYGVDYADQARRAAVYVDKILRGAKPGDLPIERPTKFELVVNLKTAKALGITIPESILLRADEVIR